jgi:hypothetical protein
VFCDNQIVFVLVLVLVLERGTAKQLTRI